jgi:uracil-DNA glycosylase
MSINKAERYRALVEKRKACRLCEECGLQNPGSPELTEWDSDDIGPWSRWLSDLDAKIVVVGQDWGDVKGYRDMKGLDSSTNPTNRRVRKFLELVGLPVPDVNQGSSNSRVFLTNAALCLRKRAGLQGPVTATWFKNCGPAFLKPLLELVRPKVVVTLGEQAYTAVLSSYHFPRQRKFRWAVEGPPIPLQKGCWLVPVYHCGTRIWNTHRKEPEQMRDWERVKQALSMEDD